MSKPEKQIELHFYRNQGGVACVKVMLVHNGKQTCIADVAVLSKFFSFPLPEESAN